MLGLVVGLSGGPSAGRGSPLAALCGLFASLGWALVFGGSFFGASFAARLGFSLWRSSVHGLRWSGFPPRGPAFFLLVVLLRFVTPYPYFGVVGFQLFCFLQAVSCLHSVMSTHVSFLHSVI